MYDKTRDFLRRLLAADYTDQAVAEHILYYLSQCLQVCIAYLQDFAADALAQLNGNVLQILSGCLVKTHAVGQGLIHRADGTDNVLVQLAFGEFFVSQPFSSKRAVTP